MIRALIEIAAIAISSTAQAAQITTGDFWGGPAIFLVGEIVPGDAKAFAAIAKTVPQAVVVLRSPGGVIDDAMAIGRTIRSKNYWTFVGRRGICASACGIVWPAGSHAVAQRGTYLMFHRVSNVDGSESLDGDLVDV
jgi:hypothetical protein